MLRWVYREIEQWQVWVLYGGTINGMAWCVVDGKK